MLNKYEIIRREFRYGFTRQVFREFGMEEAIRIIKIHHVNGYLCSCGSEVNAEWIHHTQMIQQAIDEERDAVIIHDVLCGWASPCIYEEAGQHAMTGVVDDGCLLCSVPCVCGLILKVREDERGGKESPFNAGYAAALYDAVQRVESLPMHAIDGYLGITERQVLFALRDLTDQGNPR